MTCPQCEVCWFHVRPDWLVKIEKENDFCRIMKEPCTREKCGMYIPAYPGRDKGD